MCVHASVPWRVVCVCGVVTRMCSEAVIGWGADVATFNLTGKDAGQTMRAPSVVVTAVQVRVWQRMHACACVRCMCDAPALGTW